MMLHVFWLLLAGAGRAGAVVQDANCTRFKWLFNSIGQSPCDVAGALTGPCGQPIIPTSINAGVAYGPLAGTAINNCTCNSVYYSLTSACSACQRGYWTTYPSFTQNCLESYFMQYPNSIPSDTNVPHWAYLNVSLTSESFDVAAAKRNVGPESTAVESASETSISTSGFTALPETTLTPSTSTSFSPSSIAAGVVGHVAGGVVLTALLLWN